MADSANSDGYATDTGAFQSLDEMEALAESLK